jgi:hypothetical protein
VPATFVRPEDLSSIPPRVVDVGLPFPTAEIPPFIGSPPEPPPPPPPPPPPEPPKKRIGLTAAEARLLQLCVRELSRRRVESIKLYRPLDHLASFHEDRTRTRLLIGSNRSGKTNAAAVEVARAVTGQDPSGKYPKENEIWFCFGKDEYHLGSVMYKKLFRADAFKMIRDGTTREWRLFDPVLDADRVREAKPAGPLIPPRFIEGKIVWLDKGTQAPKLIRLKNGWELHFFSAQGNIPHGQAIDGWWIDEEVDRKKLLEEIYARCIDRAGVGFWSCTPQSSTVQLYDVHDRAQRKDPDVKEWFAKLSANPYITQAEKDHFYNTLSEEARRVRYYGEFALSQFNVYPEFAPEIHAWKVKERPKIDNNWCRWLITDPGRQRAGSLFAAIPPAKMFSYKVVVIYDELYIPRCTASEFGRQVGLRSQGFVWEGGVIDKNAARIHDMGYGKRVKDLYEKALEANGVMFRGGGTPRFQWSCDDVEAGIHKVKEWLAPAGGRPVLFVVLENCPNWKWEIERYRNDRDKDTGMPIDKPIQKDNHLMDCTRYLALRDPEWRKPELPPHRKPAAVRAMERKARQRREREGDSGGSFVRLSGGSPP